ncbi:MAG: hypothetical protein WDZ85_01680 [Candidatus Paceibacterota bacterium]
MKMKNGVKPPFYGLNSGWLHFPVIFWLAVWYDVGTFLLKN